MSVPRPTGTVTWRHYGESMIEHMFDTGSRAPAVERLEGAVDAVFACLDLLDCGARLKATEAIRRRLDAGEARALAATVVGDPHGKGSARRAFVLTRDCGVSKREQRRRVNRARAVADNPQIAEHLASGAFSGDHVDAVANAARRSGGAAARDAGLLAELGSVSADQARMVTDRWVNRRTTPEKVESEHDRQRRLRTARRTTTAEGLAQITLAGDTASIEMAWRQIETAADRLYRLDGGRDLPAHQHPRSTPQRRYDAAIGALTGQSPTGNGASAGKNRCRPTILVTTQLDTIAGKDGAPPAELVGAGPLPHSVLERLCCDATMAGIIFDGAGQPLWHGRNQRSATPAQFTALVARDRACVRCGAHWSHCEAHHLLPWNAPARGETNIDTLALVCPPCHTELHERNLTLIRGPDGRYTTRAATPDEIAPNRPQRDPRAPSDPRPHRGPPRTTTTDRRPEP